MPVSFTPEAIQVGDQIRAEITSDGAAWCVYQLIDSGWVLSSNQPSKDEAATAAVILALGAV